MKRPALRFGSKVYLTLSCGIGLEFVRAPGNFGFTLKKAVCHEPTPSTSAAIAIKFRAMCFHPARTAERSLVLPAGVRIDGITVSGPDAVIHFHTFAGHQYDVETATNLSLANWFPVLGAALDGTGGTKTVTNTNALVEAVVRFYRLSESR